MAIVHHTFNTRSHAKHQVVDVTREVSEFVTEALEDAGSSVGLCTIYTPHATAAVTVNENDDPNIGTDLMRALGKMVPEHDDWLHDLVDNNAAAHIKAAIIGPSVTIPIIDGRLALGTWQNIFLCELDGPRRERRVIVTVYT